MKTIALLGAGGKMGCRIADNLRKTDWDVRYIEVSERGCAALAERGLQVVSPEKALPESDAVILALPDNRIRQITHSLDAHFKPGSMLIALDIAAPLAGYLRRNRGEAEHRLLSRAGPGRSICSRRTNRAHCLRPRRRLAPLHSGAD